MRNTQKKLYKKNKTKQTKTVEWLRSISVARVLA